MFAVSPPAIVLGTRNEGKRRELESLVAPWGLQIVTLKEFPNALEVEETGMTFAENAKLKAVQQARHLQQWVLGEDSGICVDALDGAPGVYSARYSDPDATDELNNAKLLESLGKLPLEKRTAHYVCHMTLADPQGNVQADCQQVCQGRIRFEASGYSGFGYDPLFEIAEYHQTFGELGNAVKSLISHRARALRELVTQLRFGRC